MPNSKRKAALPITHYTIFRSPIGHIGVAATRRGICLISLAESGGSSFQKTIEKEYRGRAIRRDESFVEVIDQLQTYFSGRPIKFKARIDLRQGTPFQQKVWRSLQHIPYGKTRNYQSIARDIGRPHSSRAVGGACGSNPVPLLIPCHRVIKADGRLGGFSGGLHIKQRLLALEQAKPFSGR